MQKQALIAVLLIYVPCGMLSVSSVPSPILVLKVEVADVISLETGNPIKYALRTQLQTDGYEVV